MGLTEILNLQKYNSFENASGHICLDKYGHVTSLHLGRGVKIKQRNFTNLKYIF